MPERRVSLVLSVAGLLAITACGSDHIQGPALTLADAEYRLPLDAYLQPLAKASTMQSVVYNLRLNSCFEAEGLPSSAPPPGLHSITSSEILSTYVGEHELHRLLNVYSPRAIERGLVHERELSENPLADRIFDDREWVDFLTTTNSTYVEHGEDLTCGAALDLNPLDLAQGLRVDSINRLSEDDAVVRATEERDQCLKSEALTTDSLGEFVVNAEVDVPDGQDEDAPWLSRTYPAPSAEQKRVAGIVIRCQQESAYVETLFETERRLEQKAIEGNKDRLEDDFADFKGDVNDLLDYAAEHG